MPGVLVANVDQQAWKPNQAVKVLLPMWKAQGKPFVLIYWSRDPDGTQHAQGDSLNELDPGINGPTSKAAIANASKNLAALRAALKDLGLEDETNVVVTADHGFATKSLQSATSEAAKFKYRDVVPGFMPQGFLGIDLAQALGLKLYDGAGVAVTRPRASIPGAARGRARPGASGHRHRAERRASLLYLPGADARAGAAGGRGADRQDYTAAIFVADALGPIAGTLLTSKINIVGGAHARALDHGQLRSFDTGCGEPEMCAVEVADSGQQHGQGIHGAFGRHDTHNFMAAVGPTSARASWTWRR